MARDCQEDEQGELSMDARKSAEYNRLKAQAGAVVMLASTAAILIASHPDQARIGLSEAGVDTWAIGLEAANTILTTLLQNLFGPRAERAVDEVRAIAVQAGYLTGGNVWQFPQSM